MKKTTSKKRVTRKAASKKRRSNKAPSAKQLAARRKFALAAKARAKAKKNPRQTVSAGQADRRLKTPAEVGSASTARHFYSLGWSTKEVLDKLKSYGHTDAAAKRIARAGRAVSRYVKGTLEKPARTRNKTVIVKPKRVVVLNPGSTVRRKIRNSYVSLRVHGYAKKTANGWSFASKTYPQGSGIIPITKKGFYLDEATGAVFSKQAKNPSKASPQTRKRNSATTDAKLGAIREEFTGRPRRKVDTMFVSDQSPSTLTKLAKLLDLTLTDGRIIKPAVGTTWVCADTKKKIHFATTGDRLYDAPKGDIARVKAIAYREWKPSVGSKKVEDYEHKFGEEGGTLPMLASDGKGGLYLKGGSYTITDAGIVN